MLLNWKLDLFHKAYLSRTRAIAIETEKDYFDFDPSKPINHESLYTYVEDVRIALTIIEELQLNTNIWK